MTKRGARWLPPCRPKSPRFYFPHSHRLLPHWLGGDVLFHSSLASSQSHGHGSLRDLRGTVAPLEERKSPCPIFFKAPALSSGCGHATSLPSRVQLPFVSEFCSGLWGPLPGYKIKVPFCIHMQVGCLPVSDLCSRVWSIHP